MAVTTFDSAGSGSWLCPAGVTSVAVACGAMPGCGCPNCLSKRQVTP